MHQIDALTDIFESQKRVISKTQASEPKVPGQMKTLLQGNYIQLTLTHNDEKFPPIKTNIQSWLQTANQSYNISLSLNGHNFIF